VAIRTHIRSAVKGVHDFYLRFTSPGSPLMNFD
jgi:hypothetical protein